MLFSVIIPVYNKADTIKRALDSVLTQSFRDFEVIVVDDGSTDSLADVLAAYRAPRVIRQENAGVSCARNTGIAAARGEYVCFLDADDLYTREHLATLHELTLRYPAADMLVTSSIIRTRQGETLHSCAPIADYVSKLYQDSHEAGRTDFLTQNFISLLNLYGDTLWNTNSICLRRKTLLDEGISFAAGERIGEDTDMWLRVAMRHPVAFSMRETTIYEQADSTATKNTSNTTAWVFARREEEILGASDIDREVKASISLLLDRYKLTCARELALAGDGKGARAFLARVKHRRGKRYLLTSLFCAFPLPLRRFAARLCGM
ncbi:MAG: glycosyltransferase family 2 protein [Clostridia bacterium]|nr:glycosyltransferase family 2 protein [Clostridia bacterium]